MADFSKQYCKISGFDFFDFDIEEEFDKLKEGYYVSFICEGFGSIAILNDKGICSLIFINEEDGSTIIKSLSQVIGEYKQKRKV